MTSDECKSTVTATNGVQSTSHIERLEYEFAIYEHITMADTSGVGAIGTMAPPLAGSGKNVKKIIKKDGKEAFQDKLYDRYAMICQ